MCKEVDKLEEIYNRIPDMLPFISLFKRKEDSLYEYRTENKGKFTSVSLLNEPEISIAKSNMTENSEVEFHYHINSYEIIIILKGEIKIIFKDEERVLGKFDYIVIDRGIPHAAKALVDTVFIALTVPEDEGFPKQ